MRKFKCISNTETEAHVAWGQYFKVGEIYEEQALPESMSSLAMLCEMRGDTLIMGFGHALPLLVPKECFELVESDKN